MLIDWFTVGAQGVNFIILVWLLKHFLYKPILDAVDSREKFVAAELADAAARKAEAQKDRDELQRKNTVFDGERAALLGQAVAAAGAERDRLIGTARSDAQALKTGQEKALRAELAGLGPEIARQASGEVFGIARKALADLATVSLEERMGEVFTRRLRQLDGPARDLLGAALRTSPDPAVVRSAFELPADQRAAIQNALNETFAAQVRVRFESEAGPVCGIELTANGQKVGWSISSYLDSLDRRMEGILDAASPPGAAPAPAGAAR